MTYLDLAHRYLANLDEGVKTARTPCEKSEISEKRGQGVVWWPDPTLAPLPADADDRDRQIRADFAPVVCTPPRTCIGPIVCSRIGPCDCHAAGRPCRVEGA